MFSIFREQLRSTLLSIRFYIGVLLGLSVVLLNGTYLLEFSKWIAEPLSILDIYIYSSADRFALSVCFLGALVVLSNIPFTEQNEVYTLLRVSRKKWIAGKLLYVVAISLLYHICIVLITMLYSAPDSYWGNLWSVPLYDMAVVNYGIADNWGLGFPYGYVLTHFLPVEALLISIALNSLYVASIGTILFFISLKFNRIIGFAVVTSVHMCGYIMLNIGNGFFTKYSLLGNSILAYHNYQGTFVSSKLPYLITSFFIFDAIILFFSILIYRMIKKYDFKINVGI